MDEIAKAFVALQNVRWSFALAVAGTAAAFLFIQPLKALLTPFLLGIAWLALILFGLLFVIHAIEAAWHLWKPVNTVASTADTSKSLVQPPKKFHITPMETQCWWGQVKQPDGTIGIQIYVIAVIKNLTPQLLTLLKVRIVEPDLGARVLQDMILSESRVIRANRGDKVPLHIMLGKKEPLASGHIDVTMAVQDDEGHEETVKLTLRDKDLPLI